MPPLARARLAWLPREAPAARAARRRRRASRRWFAGYYSAAVWAPIGLGLIACLLAVGIARPPRAGVEAWVGAGRPGRPRPLGAAVGALGGLGRAGDRVGEPHARARRAARPAAPARPRPAHGAVGARLVRRRRGRRRARGRSITLLGPDATKQFLGSRLDQPLGYINAQATFSILALWPLMALAEQRRSAIAAGARALRRGPVPAGSSLLSQSRGAALAVIGSALLVLAIAPGRAPAGVRAGGRARRRRSTRGRACSAIDDSGAVTGARDPDAASPPCSSARRRSASSGVPRSPRRTRLANQRARRPRAVATGALIVAARCAGRGRRRQGGRDRRRGQHAVRRLRQPEPGRGRRADRFAPALRRRQPLRLLAHRRGHVARTTSCSASAPATTTSPTSSSATRRRTCASRTRSCCRRCPSSASRACCWSLTFLVAVLAGAWRRRGASADLGRRTRPAGRRAGHVRRLGGAYPGRLDPPAARASPPAR